MRNKYLTFCVLGVGILLFLIVGAFSAEHPSQGGKISFAKTSADKVTRTLSNINNWSYWQYHDGKSGIEPAESSGGGIYPRGTGNVVFQDGLIWGMIAKEKIQTGGATYNVGTQPGWYGSDPDDDRARIYRIRADWQTLSHALVLQDAAEINVVPVGQVTEDMTAAVIAQYADDWKNWPVDLGAPYVDVDSSGTYDPILDSDGYPTTDGDYPGIANADQVLWYVVNDQDAAKVNYLYGADPVGMELQRTIWGYNQPAARLGQIIFIKYLFINKSSDVFDSMYVAQWCDPDLGGAGDDLVGCDSLLGMGFAYNGYDHDGTFDQFGIVPPAMGYDFFQGPLLDGKAGEDRNKNGVDDAEDYGIWNLRKVGPGKINLPMTSFGYFSAGNVEWQDPELQNYNGTLEWYNLLRGFITKTDVLNPTPFTNRNTGERTLWPLSGDPVTGTGDVDGTGANFSPADRRMALCSGPFVMQPGDSQEVVVALIGGHSDTYLTSITDLKLTDQVAQDVFDDLFQGIPKAPPPPVVDIYEEERAIVLNWGNDKNAVNKTENTVIANYAFEGYNVYQLPSATASKSQGVRVATFDVINDIQTIYGKVFDPKYGEEIDAPVQFGKDYGVQRFMKIEKDILNGGIKLYPGNTYYFAVTAYNYNENPQLIQDKALESAITVIPITTQSTIPGTRNQTTVYSEVEITHTAGESDGLTQVQVIDPSAITGESYSIEFVEDAELGTVWKLSKGGTVLLDKQPQLDPPDIEFYDSPIVDGIIVKVAGPPVGINYFKPGPYGDEQPYNGWNWTGDRWVSWTDWGACSFGGAMDNGFNFFGSSITEGTQFMDVELYFSDTTEAVDPDNWSTCYTYRRDLGYVFSAMGKAPFAAWDIENNRRLNICFVEDANAGSANRVWDMGWAYDEETEAWAFASSGGREYIFIMNSDYQPDSTQHPEYTTKSILDNGDEFDVLYAIWPAARGTHPYLEAKFTLQIFASNVNTPEDVFTFSTAGMEPTTNQTDLEADVEKITVYPNPYYAFNPQEPDRFTRFVNFYHLPVRTKSIIRIFDLSGVLVRKLEKPENDNTQFIRWDLRNEADLPVASGIYIAHIDMPDIGKEKVLKVFIVQPAQILRYY